MKAVEKILRRTKYGMEYIPRAGFFGHRGGVEEA
jgi:hypothetical protein